MICISYSGLTNKPSERIVCNGLLTMAKCLRHTPDRSPASFLSESSGVAAAASARNVGRP